MLIISFDVWETSLFTGVAVAAPPRTYVSPSKQHTLSEFLAVLQVGPAGKPVHKDIRKSYERRTT